PGTIATTIDYPKVILSGFLVGIGTKLSNGCTSGHMISGLSRFSRRSIVAVIIFFSAAVLTTQVLHGESLPEPAQADWSLGGHQGQIYALGTALASLWTYATFFGRNLLGKSQPTVRFAASLLTAFAFGVSLRLGNMVDPQKILAFLALPVSRAFDPSLAFLAGSALSITTLLYHSARGNVRPCAGGKWIAPSSTKIDTKLLYGSVLFGIGWGICGVCRPGLVSFGHSLYAGSGVASNASWLVAMVIGGLLVE
ncbi:hypothetical protein HYDPIDRAFT_24118, partial [Hydnomerulius pinastri MD-312]